MAVRVIHMCRTRHERTQQQAVLVTFQIYTGIFKVEVHSRWNKEIAFESGFMPLMFDCLNCKLHKQFIQRHQRQIDELKRQIEELESS